MLRVRAIKKIYGADRQLLGYVIADEATGQVKSVHKNELKQAVVNKVCEVTNMTLTSDGRFIGHACEKPKTKEKAGTGLKLAEVYTNGRKIVGGLVDSTEYYKRQNKVPQSVLGTTPGFVFEPGLMITEQIKINMYDNVKIIDGKPEMPETKRKSFKTIKPKLLKLLEGSNLDTSMTVAKGNEKYQYFITINNYAEINSAGAGNIVRCLVDDSLTTAKLKVEAFKGDIIEVKSITGIADVRKAIKL